MKALAVAAIALLAPPAALAAEGPWIKQEGVSLRLIAREAGVGERSELLFGLQVRPERGWKFFWRAPGKLGVPAIVDFVGSTNVSEATVLWPAPRRLVAVKEADDTVIGYDREVVLPIPVRPARSAAPVVLRCRLRYGVCGDLCTPGQVTLQLGLPATGAGRGKAARLIEDHLLRVPRPLAPGTFRIHGDGAALVVQLSDTVRLGKPDVFVDGGSGRHYGPPVVTLTADRRGATFRIPVEVTADAAPPPPDQVRVVLVDRGRAWEARVRVER